LLYIIIIAITLLLLLFLSTSRYQKESFEVLDKKKHPLRILYPCIAFFNHKVLKKEDNLVKEERLYTYKQASMVMFCITVSLFLVFLSELQQLSKPPDIQNNTIQRPKTFEGNKPVDAIYYIDSIKEEINLIVPEMILQGEEREKLLDTAVKELNYLILGDNTSFDCITKDLYLPTRLVNNHVIVKYKIKSLDFISYDGSIKYENASSDGNKAYVDVYLQYDTTTITKTYEFLVFPAVISSQTQLKDQLKLELQQAEKASKYEEVLILPEKIGESKITWMNSTRNQSMLLLLLGLILSALIPALMDKNKKESEESIRLQLQRDYPEIVSKLQLLLNAGMTTRGAWERIVADYLRVKEQSIEIQKNSRKYFFKKIKTYERPAYEQMLITKRELEIGQSEGLSYERFGKRCRAISYIRFSSLITQNLKMGSKGLAQLLEAEARSAFETRKEQAKQLGEKASTKLLAPTMGMLVVILCIIMVPAFMAF
jgi:hypothetical protein